MVILLKMGLGGQTFPRGWGLETRSKGTWRDQHEGESLTYPGSLLKLDYPRECTDGHLEAPEAQLKSIHAKKLRHHEEDNEAIWLFSVDASKMILTTSILSLARYLWFKASRE